VKELSGVKCKTRRGMRIDGDDGGPAAAAVAGVGRGGSEKEYDV